MSWISELEATRAPIRPLRRRLQHLRAVESGGRARAGIDRAFPSGTLAFDGQSREECGGPALEPQVPGLHGDAASPTEAEGVASIGKPIEGQTSGDVPTGPRPQPPPRAGRTPSDASWVGCRTSGNRRSGSRSRNWTNGFDGNCGPFCGGSGSDLDPCPRTDPPRLGPTLGPGPRRRMVMVLGGMPAQAT